MPATKDTESDYYKELFTALKKFQAEVPVIERSETVNTGKFQYKFAPLSKIVSVITPILDKHGLGYSQMLTSYNGRSGVKTIIFHESGARLSETVELPISPDASAQQHGSVITYFRRYALSAALGLVTDDDVDAQDHQMISPETKTKLWKLAIESYSSDNSGVIPTNNDVMQYIATMTGKHIAKLTEDDAKALISILTPEKE